MAETNAESQIVDYYTDVVLPALTERLDTAFPEFGWRRDSRGWVATNEEMTHRVLGVRADRVVAHGPAPRGFSSTAARRRYGRRTSAAGPYREERSSPAP